MRLLLKDFQNEAVSRLTRQLRFASRESRGGTAQAIALSSPTGSGKTVMVTAALEAILKGDGTAPPEPDATFLWITDQPELNEQTRKKMLEASTILTEERLRVVDAFFDEEVFAPGVVHFLNIQKLGKDKALITRGDDRTFTIWETVANTILARPGRFFVIIDEAHRGMSETAKSRNEATTIIQKFIKGSPGEIPAVPLIFGVSATPERFTALIQGAGITSRAVDISPEEVRASGLLKDVITLYHQLDATQPSDMTMLREAVKAWRRTSKKWDDYCRSEGEPIVRPILVVQVQDGTTKQLSKTDLSNAVRIIHEEAGDLPSNAIAHALQEGTRVTVGDREVRYLAPSEIQNDPDVRVVLFKTSLNTGWDCPRAEVMMSFRTAQDSTLIAQLVGRMVRTPLARRVDSEESLNAVGLYLPHYDREGLERVIERLTRADAEVMPPVEIRLGEDTITAPRAAGTEAAFSALMRLPTYVIPRAQHTSEVRRLMKLSRLLANDDIDEDAPDHSTKRLLKVLRSEHARLKKTRRFRELVEEAKKVEVRATNFTVGTDLVTEGDAIHLSISPENLEDLFDAAGRKLGEGLHKIWWRSRVAEDPSLRDAAKLELIGLCFLEEEVGSAVEREAAATVQAWLKKHNAQIRSLHEGRRQDYDEVRRLASWPEMTSVQYPNEIETRRNPKSWTRHLYASSDGTFPCKLTSWEARVLEEEMDRSDFIAWLRNSERASWALTVPYQRAGDWKPLYPDFLVLRKERGGLVVDILDPHGLHLEDSPAKAVGLALFAAKHAHDFGRIELIIADGDKLKRLDLGKEQIRKRVKQVATHEHLRELFESASE